jgi:hypothetical protein
MSSEKQIAANRRNGRKSRDPKTDTGKRRASLNALRHGLTTIGSRHPMFAGEIGRLAKALCESDDDDRLLMEKAIVIAECQVLLRCIGAQRISAIERMR